MKRKYRSAWPLAIIALAAAFAPKAAAVDKSVVFLNAQSHIDSAWNWMIPETIRTIKSTWQNQLRLIQNNPEYIFNGDAVQHYAWMKEYYPDLYAQVVEQIKAGRWAVSGGTWVGPDTNITGGESMVRQFLYGQTWLKRELGLIAREMYLPDCFGFQWQLPQIIKKSGAQYFITSKLTWNEQNRFPYDIFKWKGADGTEVLAYKTAHNYDRTPDKRAATEALVNPKRYKIDKAMISTGAGDHGGGPVQKEITTVSKLNSSEKNMQLVYGRTADVLASLTDDERSRLPVWENELYLETHRGTYTTQGAIKKYNRRSEAALEEAEKLSSLSEWLGYSPYPHTELTEAWRRTNLNQFHDILPGSSIHGVYDDAWNDAEVALNLAKTAKETALTGISKSLDTTAPEGRLPLVVYNPLSFGRTDIVTSQITLKSPVSALIAIDPVTGSEYPVQILKSKGLIRQIAFVASDVPSMGTKVFWLAPKSNNSAGSIKTGPNFIENDFYRVEIDGATGNISRIFDKVKKKEMLKQGLQVELQTLKDKAGSFPAWNLDKAQMNAKPTVLNAEAAVSVVESGPVLGELKIVKTVGNSMYTMGIRLYNDIPRIDLPMQIDWNENNTLLKLSFPLNISNDKVTYEIPYAAIDRSSTRDNAFDAARFEVSGHKWVSAVDNDGSYGISLMNDCKYGYDALKIDDYLRLRATLLKSSRDQDPVADEGRHTFTFSLIGHGNTWREADVPKQAHMLNLPLTAVQAESIKGGLGTRSVSLGGTDADNVFITAVKEPEEGSKDDIVIRVWENKGVAKNGVVLTLPGEILKAEETNLIEETQNSAKFEGNHISFDIGKFELKTFRVTLKPKAAVSPVLYKGVDLSKYYNLDGMSSNQSRLDGSLDAQGNTFAGELTPSSLVFRGIGFNLGQWEDGKANLVRAQGQKVELPSWKGDALYMLAASAGSSKTVSASADFRVLYTDGTESVHALQIAPWNAFVGGWRSAALSDSIALVMTHSHTPKGDELDNDSFLFGYDIPFVPGKTPAAVVLPNDESIFIAGLSVAKGCAVAADTVPPGPVYALKAEASDRYSPKVELSWSEAADNTSVERYYIYRSTDPQFRQGSTVMIGTAEEDRYTDSSVLGNATYYYRVAAQDFSGNIGTAVQTDGIVAGPVVSIGAKARASVYIKGEEPKNAVDGQTANNSKWCANSGAPYTLTIDLNEGKKVNKIVVMHAGSGGETADWNTKDFRLEGSFDNKTWSVLADVKGNKESVSEHSFPVADIRYIRLRVTKPTQNNDNATRIYEVQAWGAED